MPRTMPVEPSRLRATFAGPTIGVDRKAKVIYGFIVAQRGPFKSKGRGEFDDTSLRKIVALGNAAPTGLKSRFTHPSASDDSLGKFLGRARNFRLDGGSVRADLHLDRTALETPPGGGKPLGTYVMDLATSDPSAFGSSLVLDPAKVVRLDSQGRPQLDANGEQLPPLWHPRKLFAADIVDDPDATHNGLLGRSGVLPLSEHWQGAVLLDSVFAGQSREVIEARCAGYLEKYLNARFGDSHPTPAPRRPISPNLTRRLRTLLRS